MRKYKMTEKEATKGICWKYAIACLLGVSPKIVPDFVNKKKDDYMEKTREWLKKRYKKSLVYIPAGQFMETDKPRYNPVVGPDGYSIMVAETTANNNTNHAVIAKNGGMYHDPTPLDCSQFLGASGYFVIYDL